MPFDRAAQADAKRQRVELAERRERLVGVQCLPERIAADGAYVVPCEVELREDRVDGEGGGERDGRDVREEIRCERRLNGRMGRVVG